jgi:hypothetical protein
MTLKGDFVVERDGAIHGIGGWFTAEMSKTTTMTNSPLSADRINRRGVFFPVENPVSVSKGDRVNAELYIRSTEFVFTWSVNVVQGSNGTQKAPLVKGSFRHSTFHGMLLSKEGVERTRPEFVPELTLRGMARRSVLELCDGKRPVREIEAEVYRRHSGLFRSYGEAAAFVAEVTTRYTV